MSVVRLQIGSLLKACLEVVHGRDAACRAIRGRSPCKEYATESMSQARLPRNVYQPSMETDSPCLLPRALQRFSPHKRMEAARSCTFCTPARSVESHLELVLPPVLHSSTPRLPNGRKRNRQGPRNGPSVPVVVTCVHF